MSTATEYDPYAVSSGLADDFDAYISGSIYGTDAAYNGGDTVLLILDLDTDDADWPQVTEKLSTGTGWEIVDGGMTIKSENGKDRNFNKNSRAGMFLTAALAAGAGDELRKRGTPFQAATFEGLGFHWNRVKVKGFDGEEKEILTPTKFLGVKGGAAASTPAANSGGDVKTKALLKAAAKKADTHAEFIDAAFAIDGVVGNAELEALVIDEAQYVELKG